MCPDGKAKVGYRLMLAAYAIPPGAAPLMLASYGSEQHAVCEPATPVGQAAHRLLLAAHSVGTQQLTPTSERAFAARSARTRIRTRRQLPES